MPPSWLLSAADYRRVCRRHSTDLELYCKDNHIIHSACPHILKLLDVRCFGLVKKAYGRETEETMRAGITHVNKTDFLLAFCAAHHAAVNEAHIRGGLGPARLVPFDSEKGTLSARCEVSNANAASRACGWNVAMGFQGSEQPN